MTTRLLFTFVFAITAAVHAKDNSVEVTLEDTTQQEHAQSSFRGWRFEQRPKSQDSDAQFEQWEYKFQHGSDKPMGRAVDTAAIQALVPSTIPVTIRWVSRHLVVVSADCHRESQLAGRDRCLYVLEKHGAKWKLTHHYAHRWHSFTI